MKWFLLSVALEHDLSAGVVVLLLLGLLLYFYPTLTAYRRHHRDAAAICALNVLLGWSVLGWIAALVWSYTGNVREERA